MPFDSSDFTDTHIGSISKVDKYKWTTKDKPGVFKSIRKTELKVDAAYQRDLLISKTLAIASSWSWISLGAIIVANRNGVYYVIDGQHRLAAAIKRADVNELPCLVFETEDVGQEAKGFLDLNTGRKAVTMFARQKAMVAAGDPIASYVSDICEALGVVIKRSPTGPAEIKAVGWLLRRAEEDKGKFCMVLEIAADLCRKDGIPIGDRLLDGIWYLNDNCGEGLADKRLVKRLHDKGAKTLSTAAMKAAAYFAKGGSRTYAIGMLDEINKGLKLKFSIDGEDA